MPETGRVDHVSYVTHGDAAPGLVLMHGFTDSAACWDPIVPALRKRTGVVAVDARGHGESGLPEEPVGPAVQAGDVARVLDALGVTSVVAMGHSMGAVTAVSLAIAHPDRVRALILEDPPPYSGAGRPVGVPETLLKLRRMSVAERIATGRAEHPRWPDAEFQPWALAQDAFQLRFCELPVEPFPPLRESLPRVRCPVLLLYGDPGQGGLISPEFAAELAELMGDRLTTRQLDAGHSVRRDDQAGYLAAVDAFLERVLA